MGFFPSLWEWGSANSLDRDEVLRFRTLDRPFLLRPRFRSPLLDPRPLLTLFPSFSLLPPIPLSAKPSPLRVLRADPGPGTSRRPRRSRLPGRPPRRLAALRERLHVAGSSAPSPSPPPGAEGSSSRPRSLKEIIEAGALAGQASKPSGLLGLDSSPADAFVAASEAAPLYGIDGGCEGPLEGASSAPALAQEALPGWVDTGRHTRTGFPIWAGPCGRCGCGCTVPFVPVAGGRPMCVVCRGKTKLERAKAGDLGTGKG